MTIASIIESTEPDLRWKHLWSGTHRARGQTYDLQVSRELDGGQLRIFVFKCGEFVAYLMDPTHDVQSAIGSDTESTNVEDLIAAAVSDIDENNWDMY